MGSQASYGADAIQQLIRQRMLDQIAADERKRRAMADDREFQLRQQEMEERRLEREQDRQDRLMAGQAAGAERAERQLQTIAGNIVQETVPGTSLDKPIAGVLRAAGRGSLVKENPEYAFPPMLETGNVRETNIGDQPGDVYTGTAYQQRQVRQDETAAENQRRTDARQAARDAQTDADRTADNERADRALAIQQGQLDLAREKTNQPDAKTSDYSVEHNQRSIDAVDDLLKDVGFATAGLASPTSYVPMTPARNFSAKLNTLKSNIAFNELSQMRAASKTGGALGAVSERELALLESSLGALDQGQSPGALAEQLKKIKESLQRWKDAHVATQPLPNDATVNVDKGTSGFRVVGSRPKP